MFKITRGTVSLAGESLNTSALGINVVENAQRSTGSFRNFDEANSVAGGAKPERDNVQPWVHHRDQLDSQAWDDREEGAYRHYLAEQGREYCEFNKQNRIVQRHYRIWREAHPEFV
jgi:hypothetical protein